MRVVKTNTIVDNWEKNVDNRTCKINFLAKTMLSYLGRIDDTVSRHPVPSSQLKSDSSPVTPLDLALSKLVEDVHDNHFPESIFYSEENFGAWGFPLMVIDPLDGTREYIEGKSDWSVSIGYFTGPEFRGEGWVYNPKTRELFDESSVIPFKMKSEYRGEVSRWEWKGGLYTSHKSDKFVLEPKGSIAYKLGRLSAGKIDFVVSLKPKNIWDIAGGTLLSLQAGLKFYSQGKLVTEVEKTYRPPLIWCREELFLELSVLFP